MNSENKIKDLIDLIDKFKLLLKQNDRKNALIVFQKIRELYEKETGKDFKDEFPTEKIDEIMRFLGESTEISSLEDISD